MGGGLMQLVAYGAQDIYLTGNPMITYFKVVYRRHTNFASESIEQVFNGAADFGKRVSCVVARSGDLINRVTLEATLPAVVTDGGSFKWVDDVGNYLVSDVNVEIGGQEIDKHYGDWLNIWASLTVPVGLRKTYDKMIGNYPIWDRAGTVHSDDLSLNVWNQSEKASVKLYVPLQFWFCRNVGLSLPLIALQYHEVKVNLTFAAANTLYHHGPAESFTPLSNLHLESASLWIDYVFLDTDERRRFAQVSHEYLIEQLQVNSASFTTTTSTQQVKLTFNHPVKALYWYAQEGTYLDNNWLSNWTDRPSEPEDEYYSVEPVHSRNPVRTSKLQLNGHDRYAQRDGNYFSLVENYYHNNGGGRYPGLNQYNFALKPEEHQPSGSCNFSRIDNATLSMTLAYADGSTAHSGNIQVYAVNYNVLRIMSGMGGLAYSN